MELRLSKIWVVIITCFAFIGGILLFRTEITSAQAIFSVDFNGNTFGWIVSFLAVLTMLITCFVVFTNLDDKCILYTCLFILLSAVFLYYAVQYTQIAAAIKTIVGKVTFPLILCYLGLVVSIICIFLTFFAKMEDIEGFPIVIFLVFAIIRLIDNKDAIDVITLLLFIASVLFSIIKIALFLFKKGSSNIFLSIFHYAYIITCIVTLIDLFLSMEMLNVSSLRFPWFASLIITSALLINSIFGVIGCFKDSEPHHKKIRTIITYLILGILDVFSNPLIYNGELSHTSIGSTLITWLIISIVCVLISIALLFTNKIPNPKIQLLTMVLFNIISVIFVISSVIACTTTEDAFSITINIFRILIAISGLIGFTKEYIDDNCYIPHVIQKHTVKTVKTNTKALTTKQKITYDDFNIVRAEYLKGNITSKVYLEFIKKFAKDRDKK